MFGFGFYDAFIIAGMLGIQYFFSTRNSVYWGAIIPVLLVIWLTWMLITVRIESILAYVLILIVGIIFLIEQWSNGRKSLRKHRKKELEKMQSHDMN